MSTNPVVAYYRSIESRFGYRVLKGVKHFGYYPSDKPDISMSHAQMLMNAQLALRLDLPNGSKVLDAGCGEGNVALYMAKNHGMNVEGIDLLDFNVTNAKKTALSQGITDMTKFQVGTYMNLPFADNYFDAVYTMETLVHAPDYKKALTEFYRVLKPGGKLVLFEYTIIADNDVKPLQQKAIKRIKQINRVAAMPAFNEFTFGSMPAKLSAAGFKKAATTDITPRMLPLLKKFHDKAKFIYIMSRLLHLENHLINGMSAVEFYENQDLWKYEISTAIK